MSDATGSARPLLRFDRVSKGFGTTNAVQNVSFDISPGEVVGLVGDNGAGKSTIVKLITGYHSPSTGKIFFDGRLVRLTSPSAARGLGIEAVFQDLALVDVPIAAKSDLLIPAAV